MPHFVVDCSRDVLLVHTEATVISHLHRVVNASGLFEEADIKVGRISVASPLARGLLGHEIGDEVRVQMPAGPRTFEILDVSFPSGLEGEASLAASLANEPDAT